MFKVVAKDENVVHLVEAKVLRNVEQGRPIALVNYNNVSQIRLCGPPCIFNVVSSFLTDHFKVVAKD